MHCSSLRFGTLFLFALVSLSYALPTVDYGSTSELVERAGAEPKPKPAPKPPGTKPKPKPAPKKSSAKPNATTTPAKKPANATSNAQADGNDDGQVPISYQPKIRTRSADILDAVLEARSADLDRIDDLVVRDLHYDLLEARKGGGAADAIADVVTGIVNIIQEKVQEDNDARSKFTQETVANGRQKFPHFNWAICHVKHTTKFDGVKGKDWGHQHHEVDIKIGGTIGYEIYWFKGGTFTRQGDGGYLNWAWSGYPKDVSNNGATIVFNAPP